MNKILATLVVTLILSSCTFLFLPISIDDTSVKVGSQNESDNTSILQLTDKSKENSIRSPLSPNRVALLFPTVTDQTEEQNAPPMQTHSEIQTATWIKSLGTIKDETGVERHYFKDTRSGSILKFRSDGTLEKGYRLIKSISGNREILTPEGSYLLQGEGQ